MTALSSKYNGEIAVTKSDCQAGYRTVVLPSSSPAHMAMSFEQKLAVWRRLVDPGLDAGATAQLF